MAVVTNYPKHSSEWLKHELDPELYRAEVTVVAGAGDIKTGTVMGKITATGKWTPHVNGAVDGTETAAGILLHGVDASGVADVKAVIVTGEARIAALKLDWHASVNDTAKKNAALDQLASLGFKTAYQS